MLRVMLNLLPITEIGSKGEPMVYCKDCKHYRMAGSGKNIFEHSYHAYCLAHLLQIDDADKSNINGKLTPKNSSDYYWGVVIHSSIS